MGNASLDLLHEGGLVGLELVLQFGLATPKPSRGENDLAPEPGATPSHVLRLPELALQDVEVAPESVLPKMQPPPDKQIQERHFETAMLNEQHGIGGGW